MRYDRTMTRIKSDLASSMRKGARKATAALRVMANADRLLLLCELCHAERCVGELESLLDLHQPTLSQQLAVLRRERLVRTRRSGKRIYYSVADARVGALLGALQVLYCK